MLHYVDPAAAEIAETRAFLIVSGQRRRVDDREYRRAIGGLSVKIEPPEADNQGDQSHGR